jgi:hypothetical protein
LPTWPAFYSIEVTAGGRTSFLIRCGHQRAGTGSEIFMRKLLLILGFLALAIGLLWIGQGTGAIAWPASSFMIGSLQWAQYGALLSAVGLVLIWQGKR